MVIIIINGLSLEIEQSTQNIQDIEFCMFLSRYGHSLKANEIPSNLGNILYEYIQDGQNMVRVKGYGKFTLQV